MISEPPEREWLLYAHYPLKERKRVEIRLPGYGAVRIDVRPVGSSCRILEKGKVA